jgi:hypothetical protein
MGEADGDLHCIFIIQAVAPYHYDLNQILALPSGFRYHNRYSQAWVDRNLQQGIVDQLHHKRLLLIMRDKARNLLVPVRWATIELVQPIGGVYYFEYRLGELIDYKSDAGLRNQEIEHHTQTLGQYHSALPGTPGTDLTSPSVFLSAAGTQFPTAPADDLAHWGNVVAAVATAEIYEKVDFLKIVGLRTSDKRKRASLVGDGYLVAPNTVYTLLIFQTMPNFGDNIVEPHDLRLLTFPGHVASLRERQRAVGKYDMLTFDLKVLDLPSNERTSIEVAHDESYKPGQYASGSLYIPLVVRRRQYVLPLARLALATVALILVFAPGWVPADPQLVRNAATVVFVVAIAGAGRAIEAIWPPISWR